MNLDMMSGYFTVRIGGGGGVSVNIICKIMKIQTQKKGNLSFFASAFRIWTNSNKHDAPNSFKYNRKLASNDRTDNLLLAVT